MHKKGMVFVFDLFIFALIVAISLGILYILSAVPALSDAIALKSQVQFIVLNNDRGSVLSSLMSATRDGKSYEEIIGEASVGSMPEDLDSAINSIVGENKLLDSISVTRDGVSIKTYGQVGKRTAKADIALPGGKKGEVTVS